MKISRQIIYPLNYFKIIVNFFSISRNNYKKKITNKLKLSKKTIFLGRARTGIFLAVKLFLNNKRPNVLMSPYTIPDVINMVICAGGIPVFIDFSKKTTFIDIDKIKKSLLSNSSILILTHYNINEENYKKIKSICNKSNISLVEDCAISNSSYSNNIPIGSLSNASVYSFSTFKFLNFFYGGLISVKSNKDFKRLNEITYKWKKLDFYDYVPQMIKTIKYNLLTSKNFFTFITFNLLKFYKTKKNGYLINRYSKYSIRKMDKTYFSKPHDAFFIEICRKLKDFNFYQEIRRNNALIYYKYLKSLSIPWNINKDLIKKSSCYNYTIYVKDKTLLQKYLLNKGFDTGNAMYENCSKYPYYKKFKGTSKNIDDLIKYSLVLPTHYEVNKGYAKNLSRTILNYYSR